MPVDPRPDAPWFDTSTEENLDSISALVVHSHAMMNIHGYEEMEQLSNMLFNRIKAVRDQMHREGRVVLAVKADWAFKLFQQVNHFTSEFWVEWAEANGASFDQVRASMSSLGTGTAAPVIAGQADALAGR